MKTVIILSGIPCSGKSTLANQLTNSSNILSRDAIREELFGENYIHNKHDEEIVTNRFYDQLHYLLTNNKYLPVIIDNTNCKELYIYQLISYIDTIDKFIIIIKKLDIPLWKALYRNIIRYFKTGKYIPYNVMKNMYKNYKSINWKKYEQYMVHK